MKNENNTKIQLHKLAAGLIISVLFLVFGRLFYVYAPELMASLSMTGTNIEILYMTGIGFYVFAAIPLLFSLPEKYAFIIIAFAIGFHIGHYDSYVNDMANKKHQYLMENPQV